MKIGFVDVDGHNSFPNFALMRIAGYYKDNGILCDSIDYRKFLENYFDVDLSWVDARLEMERKQFLKQNEK